MALAALVAISPAVVLPAATASADDPTVSYQPLRTGWDQNEPGLSRSAVSSSDFGQLFSTAVDGQVLAQPVTANGTLVVATENDKVYAMDAATGAVHWTRDVGPAWPAATIGCGNVAPTIGVTSTPVFDASTGTVYLTAKVNDGPDAAHPDWYLHALDSASGAERPGFPALIGGAPDNDPTHPFNPETELQRPGLLLLGGVVYAAFGSDCDLEPYVGDVVGINASTGSRAAMWSDEAGSSTSEAGIWQSGGGLVSDGPGRILLATGNGVSPPPGPGEPPPSTLAESVVRLQVNANGTLTPSSYFSPYNNTNLDREDADLGSGGPMELPQPFGTPSHPHLVVQVGKDGRVYLLDADHLGGTNQKPGGGDNVVGMTGPFNGVWGHPAFWGGDGGYVYTVENGGYLRALHYGVTGDGTPALSSAGTSAGTFGYSSGSPVVTSDGTTSGSALVWVVYSTGPTGAGGQLRAYAAVPQGGVLPLVYEASIGTASKFSVPATDAGRVYVGTADGHVLAFGHPTTSVLQTAPTDFGLVGVGQSASQTVTVTAARAVTVTGVSTSAPFSATAPPMPVSLAEGDTLSVPVSFNPTTTGPVSANLSFATDEGNVNADVHGTGTSPGLAANPPSLSFPGVPTGSTSTLDVNIANTGTSAETITGVAAPAAPFTVVGLPAVGSTIPAQGSVSVAVSYAPTATNDDTGTLAVTGTDGGVSVPLNGTSTAGAAHLSIQPNPLAFGAVPIGESATLQFGIANTGNIPLTITKASAPTGVFSTATPIAEGQQLAPGTVIHQSITFTPTAKAPATATYGITGNDGQGPQPEQLSGSGVADPVASYYSSLGGAASYLGTPRDNVYPLAGGESQDFVGGSIFWSPATGAHAVHGAILARYETLGGPGGFLGFPVSDQVPTGVGGGSYNKFADDGAIYWTGLTKASSVHGAILDHYLALGGPAGILGYPLSDEMGAAGGIGRYNRFSGGGGAAVYWSPPTGAWSIHGKILAHYQGLGGPVGLLGYPTTDETATPDGRGRFNGFANDGAIYWTAATGAWAVHGAIYNTWASMGWEAGPVGYPTSDEYAIPGGRRSNFVAGRIAWTAATGATSVTLG
jgi:hypothetical protein